MTNILLLTFLLFVKVMRIAIQGYFLMVINICGHVENLPFVSPKKNQLKIHVNKQQVFLLNRITAVNSGFKQVGF
jgi:hypothetical protein